jgi:hypothetical protein
VVYFQTEPKEIRFNVLSISAPLNPTAARDIRMVPMLFVLAGVSLRHCGVDLRLR